MRRCLSLPLLRWAGAGSHRLVVGLQRTRTPVRLPAMRSSLVILSLAACTVEPLDSDAACDQAVQAVALRTEE